MQQNSKQIVPKQSLLENLDVKSSKEEREESQSDDQETQKNGRWSPTEDELLRKAVELLGEKRWKEISPLVPGRSPLQCLHRWTKILRPGVVKGTWTPKENELLREWVKHNGPNKWSECSKLIPGRSGKQCREHWFNKLDPGVKKGNWTVEEDEKIFRLYQKYGTSWSKIEKYLPGRTENSIKNRFYSALRRLEPKEPNAKKLKKAECDSLENGKSVDEKLTATDSAITSSMNSQALQTPSLSSQRGPNDCMVYPQHQVSTNNIPETVFHTQLTHYLEKMPQLRGELQYPNESFQHSREFCDEDVIFENFLSRMEHSLTPHYLQKEFQEDNQDYGALNDLENLQQNLVTLGADQLKRLDLHLFEGNMFSKDSLYQKISHYTSPLDFQQEAFSNIPKSNGNPSSLDEMYRMIDGVMEQTSVADEEKLIFLFKQIKKLEDVFEATKNESLDSHKVSQTVPNRRTELYTPEYEKFSFYQNNFY